MKMEKKYSERDLVSFGKYMVSPERFDSITCDADTEDADYVGARLSEVSDADIRNWEDTLKDKVVVGIINKSINALPEYATPSSAGMDLRANIPEFVVLNPMERKLIPTGLSIALPEGFEAQIRPRSGLALKHGITVLNTPGTIDAELN